LLKVGVSVELLGVHGVGDNGVGAEETCYMWVIIARPVVVDTQLGVKPLRRVAVIGGRVVLGIALLAPGVVAGGAAAFNAEGAGDAELVGVDQDDKFPITRCCRWGCDSYSYAALCSHHCDRLCNSNCPKSEKKYSSHDD
jgi:hypothetical protein